MNNTKRNEKGFTMVELIIVVAIMGIIGALLVPAFGAMSAKARLTTDLSTVKTLKRTADSYKAELGSYPNATNLTGLNTELNSKGYLDADAKLQTATGTGSLVDVSYNNGTGAIALDLSGVTDTDTQSAILAVYLNNKDFIVNSPVSK